MFFGFAQNSSNELNALQDALISKIRGLNKAKTSGQVISNEKTLRQEALKSAEEYLKEKHKFPYFIVPVEKVLEITDAMYDIYHDSEKNDQQKDDKLLRDYLDILNVSAYYADLDTVDGLEFQPKVAEFCKKINDGSNNFLDKKTPLYLVQHKSYFEDKIDLLQRQEEFISVISKDNFIDQFDNLTSITAKCKMFKRDQKNFENIVEITKKVRDLCQVRFGAMDVPEGKVEDQKMYQHSFFVCIQALAQCIEHHDGNKMKDKLSVLDEDIRAFQNFFNLNEAQFQDCGFKEAHDSNIYIDGCEYGTSWLTWDYAYSVAILEMFEEIYNNSKNKQEIITKTGEVLKSNGHNKSEIEDLNCVNYYEKLDNITRIDYKAIKKHLSNEKYLRWIGFHLRSVLRCKYIVREEGKSEGIGPIEKCLDKIITLEVYNSMKETIDPVLEYCLPSLGLKLAKSFLLAELDKDVSEIADNTLNLFQGLYLKYNNSPFCKGFNANAFGGIINITNKIIQRKPGFNCVDLITRCTELIAQAGDKDLKKHYWDIIRIIEKAKVDDTALQRLEGALDDRNIKPPVKRRYIVPLALMVFVFASVAPFGMWFARKLPGKNVGAQVGAGIGIFLGICLFSMPIIILACMYNPSRSIKLLIAKRGVKDSEQRTQEELLEKLRKIAAISEGLESNNVQKAIDNLDESNINEFYYSKNENSSRHIVPRLEELQGKDWKVKEEGNSIALTYTGRFGRIIQISYTSRSFTPLAYAIFKNVDGVDGLLDKAVTLGVNLNLPVKNPCPLSCLPPTTALLSAVEIGDRELVYKLLKKGANPDYPCNPNTYKNQPLKKACISGRIRIDIVSLLLQYNANVNDSEIFKAFIRLLRVQCDLEGKLEEGALDVIKLFLEKGVCNDSTQMASAVGISVGKRPDIFALLLNFAMENFHDCGFIDQDIIKDTIRNEQYDLTARLLMRMALQNDKTDQIPKDIIKYAWGKIKECIVVNVLIEEANHYQLSTKKVPTLYNFSLSEVLKNDSLQQKIVQSPKKYGLTDGEKNLEGAVKHLESIIGITPQSSKIEDVNVENYGPQQGL